MRRLCTGCADDAVNIADTVDPTVHADTASKRYQQRMSRRGEYVGAVALRLVYGDVVGPWQRMVNIVIDDVRRLVAGTGWLLQDHSDRYDGLARE